MEYIINPKAVDTQTWVWSDDVFNTEELNYLQSLARRALQPGVTHSEDTHYRVSKIEWLFNNKNTRWVFEKLGSCIAELNSRFFNFNLTGFGEPFQLTNYLSEESGTYDWHIDMGSEISRKLSVVVQLSHPEEYTGGELQFMSGNIPETVEKKRGMVVVFPSYVLHRVTPVTSGTRQSLVNWVTGPQFR